MPKKKLWADFQRIFESITQKVSLCSQMYGFGIRNPRSEIRDPRSGIRKKHIPDPGSRVKKAPDPGFGSATLVFSVKIRKNGAR